MPLFSRLFGGTPKAASETYKGFTITPTPIRDGENFRISARIEKEVDGEVRTHTLIRADTLDDPERAVLASAGKARQLIDEQGDRLFG